MANRSRKPAANRKRSKLLKAVVDHPVAAAGIAGAAVVGAIVAKKAANTAAKVVTMNAAAKGAADVARAVRGGKKPRKAGRRSKAKKA